MNFEPKKHRFVTTTDEIFAMHGKHVNPEIIPFKNVADFQVKLSVLLANILDGRNDSTMNVHPSVLAAHEYRVGLIRNMLHQIDDFIVGREIANLETMFQAQS